MKKETKNLVEELEMAVLRLRYAKDPAMCEKVVAHTIIAIANAIRYLSDNSVK